MATQLLINPGFEISLFPWTPTGTAQFSTYSHTGTGAAQLTTTSGGTNAEISQFSFGPFIPGATLRLSFFATKRPEPTANSDITASVILFSPFFPFILPGITISVPAAQNPSGVDIAEFDYYEGYSAPLPLGITGALVAIRNAPPATNTTASNLTIDDVFLVQDVL